MAVARAGRPKLEVDSAVLAHSEIQALQSDMERAVVAVVKFHQPFNAIRKHFNIPSASLRRAISARAANRSTCARGRRTSLTPEQEQEVIARIEAHPEGGVSLNMVCDIASEIRDRDVQALSGMACVTRGGQTKKLSRTAAANVMKRHPSIHHGKAQFIEAERLRASTPSNTRRLFTVLEEGELKDVMPSMIASLDEFAVNISTKNTTYYFPA